MNAAGLIIMLLSVGGATTFFVWCLYRVFTTPNETEHLHSTYDHTPDEDPR